MNSNYFIIKFPQRPGALKEFLTHVLGPQDDITHFEYTKKHNRELGPAIIGILLQDPADYAPLIKRMQEHNINFQTVNDQELLFGLLI